VIIEAYTCDDIGTWQTCCVAYVTLSCLQVAQVVSGYVKCERGLYKWNACSLLQHWFMFRYVGIQDSFRRLFFKISNIPSYQSFPWDRLHHRH